MSTIYRAVLAGLDFDTASERVSIAVVVDQELVPSPRLQLLLMARLMAELMRAGQQVAERSGMTDAQFLRLITEATAAQSDGKWTL